MKSDIDSYVNRYFDNSYIFCLGLTFDRVETGIAICITWIYNCQNIIYRFLNYAPYFHDLAAGFESAEPEESDYAGKIDFERLDRGKMRIYEVCCIIIVFAIICHEIRIWREYICVIATGLYVGIAQ